MSDCASPKLRQPGKGGWAWAHAHPCQRIGGEHGKCVPKNGKIPWKIPVQFHFFYLHHFIPWAVTTAVNGLTSLSPCTAKNSRQDKPDLMLIPANVCKCSCVNTTTGPIEWVVLQSLLLKTIINFKWGQQMDCRPSGSSWTVMNWVISYTKILSGSQLQQIWQLFCSLAHGLSGSMKYLWINSMNTKINGKD